MNNSHPYTFYQNGTFNEKQMVLYFSNDGDISNRNCSKDRNESSYNSRLEAICQESNRRVQVLISLEAGIVKYEIQLDSLPYMTPKSVVRGWEVIARFHTPEIVNEGVFYTDSNGLRMQKRRLN